MPACEDCNQQGSKDAEYFRLCLAMNPFTKDAPSVVSLKPTIQQSLQRPQATGFLTALLTSLKPDGDDFQLTVDMGRIHLVVRRIVQCLYLHETGTSLPVQTHESRVLSIESLGRMEADRPQKLRDDIITPLMQEPINLYADNQFAYWVTHTNVPFVSAWALLFYGRLPFIGFTGKKVKDPE
ncbi:hypothetical protein [Thalassoglobus polymorphus]|uniref:hypothetical protein n=1 Tax=Thalassoglobus polymorphus TaxID=2527994 RepID=UPI0011A2B0CD|nr:hypothetical protein [Thalassoglobus polymorphus]